MSLTRRRLIQVGVIGTVALAVGGVGLALRAGEHREPSGPLLALSPRAFSILAAAADRIIAVPGLPSAAEAQVAEQVDALLATLHPSITAQLEQGLALLENAAVGLIVDQRLTTFTGSAPHVQDQVLLAWSQASIGVFRQVYRAIQGLCMGVYWVNPQVNGFCGYPGPPDFSAILEAP